MAQFFVYMRCRTDYSHKLIDDSHPIICEKTIQKEFYMQTETIKVTGMTCGGCVNSVTRALNNVSGVQTVNVELSSGLVSVQYNETLTSSATIKAAIQAAGYGVDSSQSTTNSQGNGCCG